MQYKFIECKIHGKRRLSTDLKDIYSSTIEFSRPFLFSELQGYEKVITFIQSVSGRGAARLAHLLGVQGVAGSNPAVPTNGTEKIMKGTWN